MPVPQSSPAKRRTWQTWEKHVRAWRSSGLSQTQYARQHKIHPRTFFDWCCKIPPDCPPPSAQGSGLPKIPPQLPVRSAPPRVQFVPVPAGSFPHHEQGPEPTAKLTIRLGDRFRISIGEGVSSSFLARVVQVLEGIR